MTTSEAYHLKSLPVECMTPTMSSNEMYQLTNVQINTECARCEGYNHSCMLSDHFGVHMQSSSMNPAYPTTPGGYPATGSTYGPPPGSAGSHSGSLGFNPNVIPGPGGASSYPYTSVSAGTYFPAAQSSSLHQPLYSKTGPPTYSQASSPTGAPPPYTPTPTYTYQPPHLSAPQYVTPQPTYPSSMTQFTPQYSPSPVIHHTTVVQQPYENAMAGGMSASSALSMAAMQRPTSYPSPYTSPYQPRLGYHWWGMQDAGAKYYKDK